MAEDTDLTTAWATAQSHLPEGWQLTALRCASTSLREEDRSTDWLAIAVGPQGEERIARSSNPVEALFDLADSLANV